MFFLSKTCLCSPVEVQFIGKNIQPKQNLYIYHVNKGFFAHLLSILKKCMYMTLALVHIQTHKQHNATVRVVCSRIHFALNNDCQVYNLKIFTGNDHMGKRKKNLECDVKTPNTHRNLIKFIFFS